MKLLKTLLLAVSLAALPAAWADVTLAGIKYADSAELGGQKLQLNGAGIRYKTIIKVYTAGLYLTKKAATSEEAYAAAGPKRISIVMLREIDSGELGKLFTRSVEDNLDKAAFSKVIPGLVRMSQLFTDIKKLEAGDGFNIDWVPGTGTIISVKGVPQGAPFKEPEFYIAMMRIWLGPNPADWKLKEAMLGKAG